MPLPAHIKAIFRFRRNEALASCTCFYRVTAGTPTNANMQAIADEIGSTLNASWASVMAAPVQVGSVEVTYTAGDVQLEASSAAEHSVVDGGVGGSLPTLDCMPEENAVVLQKRTNLAGRSKRGRWFVPFVPESFFVDSSINAVGLPIYVAHCQNLIQALPAGGVTITPVHVDWKNNTLHDLVHIRVVGEVMSRRDRRFVKKPFVHNGA